MAEDFRVEGADALLQLGKRLKASGGAPVMKELRTALQKGAKPITPKSRENARARLPKSGGFAERVAKAPQRVTARVGRTTASVRVTAGGKKSGASGANKGTIRHPVYGRPGSFVSQKVPPGWFDDATESEGPKAREVIVDVMVEFAERLTKPL